MRTDDSAEAWREAMQQRRAGAGTGPLGCLFGLLMLPVVIMVSVFLVLTTWWRVRKMRKKLQEVGSRTPAVSPHSEREVALCSFVRALALDPTFTREEALSTAVVSTGGLAASELLDEAQHRGWVTGSAERLAVTPTGLERAEAYLHAQGR